jgi:cytochrome c553
MRHLLAFQLVAVAVACRTTATDPPTERGAPPAPAAVLPSARPAPVAVDGASHRPAPQPSRMRAHFHELHDIEAAILRGDLDAARERASTIELDVVDGNSPEWAPYIDRLRTAATAVSRAESLDDACRLQARLLGECAGCHEASRAKLSFAAPEAPPDEASVSGRMARHRWAADRAWEGLVGLSAKTWSAGLRVMAAAPMPGSDMSPDPAQWERLTRYGQALQRSARRATSARTVAARTAAYGELLVVCNGCHSKLESEW